MRVMIYLMAILTFSIPASGQTYNGTFLLSEQMSDWCIGETQYQNFCHGFLQGVYESGSCLQKQKTPDWNELKRVYIKWVFIKGDKAFISAMESAKAAFQMEYGCS